MTPPRFPSLLTGGVLLLAFSTISCGAEYGGSARRLAAGRRTPGFSGFPDASGVNNFRSVNDIDPRTFDAPAGRNAYGAPNSTATVPMVFPILGRGYGFSDQFGAQRDGHRHLGQDLFAPKMTPLVAVFDGTIHHYSYGGRADGSAPHHILRLDGDNGYTAKYMHVNNDTPGTNDGRGGAGYAFAPGLVSGQQVRAGQFIGWVGNSGNAESTPSHTHFELWGPDGMVTNPTASLRRAARRTRALPDVSVTDERPPVGWLRYDGIVVGVDPGRGVLILNLLATTDRKGTFAATRPGRTYVRVAPGTVVREEETGAAVRFGEILPGQRISLEGRTPARNRKFVAARAAVRAERQTPRWFGQSAW
ncbi:MAG: M23 family metallopeptidase [Capsulimonadales bacterium]|nr:M23 family metallopeptidase [Capsulimonadales bacterium]